MKKFKFGRVFQDQLSKVTARSGHFHSKFKEPNWQDFLIGSFVDGETSESISPWSRLFFLIIFIILFSILAFRLFHLQIVQGSHNRELADFNRIQVKVIHAPRGVIYDRNGNILAQNEPGFRLIEKDPKTSQIKITHLTRDEALSLEVKGDPRFKDLEIESNRAYPQLSQTSHILGYVGEITGEELKDPKFLGYQLGDIVGRGGVEQTYEKVLRGADGGEVNEVDAQGKKVRTLNKKEAIPGQNLYLTIDLDLQKLAYSKLEEAAKKAGSCCAALVAEDPKTGQILSLVSFPTFDPTKISEALTAPNSPFLNRVIAGTYPPGSTFKIASALAGLSSGKINQSTKFEDTGVMSLGPFTFANWYFIEYGRKEGLVDVEKALKRSNDIFFYKVGELTGEKTLAFVAKQLGLGERLGVDIPGEEAGLIPDNAWKVKNTGQSWYPGDTLHMAIGQGFVLTTPLQVNFLTSTIAADGKQYPPFLALKITSPEGREIKSFKFDPLNSHKFETKDLDLIKKGLAEVPKNGGTAWPFFTFPISTAGKTGTAEFGDPKNRTHAWYTAYGPVDDPKLTLTVLIEAGGEGSTVSSPVAKEVFRWYFSPDKSNLIKDTNTVATESAKTLGE